LLGEDQRRLLEGGIAPEPIMPIIMKRDVSPVAFSGDERPPKRPDELQMTKPALDASDALGVALIPAPVQPPVTVSNWSAAKEM
jgi:hypothetical protein